MRFKRAMAASMAAVMAIGSAVVCQITASAAEKTIDLSGFQGWGGNTVDAATKTITFAANYGGCGYWGNPGVEDYDELVLTYHDLTTDALTLVAKVDDDNKAEKYSNASSGEIVVDITGLDRANIGSLMITGGLNAGSVVIDSIIARNAKTYGEETVLWNGSECKKGDVYDLADFDYSKLTDDAQFTIYMTTTDHEEAKKGDGVGQIVANYHWTDPDPEDSTKTIGRTIQFISPGQSISDGTYTFTKKDLLNVSTETELQKVQFQVYKEGVTVTKVTVKDVEQSDIEVSSLTIEGDKERTATYGDADVTLTVAPNPDATTYDESKVTWKSSNEKVATVSADGTVSFVGAGSATITATYDNDSAISDSVTFTVAQKAVTATITAKDVTDATVNEAQAMAEAAVTVDTTLDKADYDLTVTLAADKKSYTASVALTEAAAKKYALTCEDASGKIAYKVTGLILSADTLTIPITSEGVQLEATIKPEGLVEGVIEWKIDDPTVATVENGLVKPVSGSAGSSAIITATVKGTTVSATCNVTIAEVLNYAAEITLDKTELSGTAGETATLKATVVGEDPTKPSTDVVTWKSSDEKVATVTAGNVTFVGAGTATITATAGEKTATCTVTVKAATVAVEKVTLDKTTAELTVGDTTTLKATVTPDNATDKTVTWTSSDESIATVKDGVVTAVKAGTATITAKAGDKTATCAVTVKAKEETPAANEKVIWKGSTDLGTDWSKSVAVPKADVKIGDTIRIKVGTGSAEYHQIKIMDSNWEVLSSVKSKADAQYGTINVDKDGYIEFVVNAADAKLISEGGLIISGYDLTISSVSNKALKDETYAPSTKVHTVVKNGTSMIAVFAISEEDAAKYESYTVTITRGSDNKSAYYVIDNCYKYVTYNNGTEDIRVSGDGAYYIMLNITGIQDSFGEITIRIDPTVPKG